MTPAPDTATPRRIHKGVTVRGAIDCIIAQTCIRAGVELLTSDGGIGFGAEDRDSVGQPEAIAHRAEPAELGSRGMVGRDDASRA